jgi:predicted Zn-dependent protease
LLHHDSENLMQRDNATRTRALAATILLGPTIGTALAMTGIAGLDSLHNSRAAKEAADLKGADTSAAAGYDPWGFVWLFQDFSAANLKTPPEILSDHPNDTHRIAQLEAHFAANPSVFGAFNQNAKLSTHLHLPKNEAIEIHFRGDNVFYDLRDHRQRLLGEVPLSDITREQVET